MRTRKTNSLFVCRNSIPVPSFHALHHELIEMKNTIIGYNIISRIIILHFFNTSKPASDFLLLIRENTDTIPLRDPLLIPRHPIYTWKYGFTRCFSVSICSFVFHLTNPCPELSTPSLSCRHRNLTGVCEIRISESSNSSIVQILSLYPLLSGLRLFIEWRFRKSKSIESDAMLHAQVAQNPDNPKHPIMKFKTVDWRWSAGVVYFSRRVRVEPTSVQQVKPKPFLNRNRTVFLWVGPCFQIQPRPVGNHNHRLKSKNSPPRARWGSPEPGSEQPAYPGNPRARPSARTKCAETTKKTGYEPEKYPYQSMW